MSLRAHSAASLLSAAALATAFSLAVAGPAAAQTTPAAATVPAGVTVAGVDLSGAAPADAIARLETARPTIQRNVSVQVGAHKYALSASQAGYSLDTAASAAAALAATQPGAVAPVVKYNETNVRAFVKKLAGKELRKPVDAKITIRPEKITVKKHKVGRRVEVNPLTAQITKALKDPVLPRNLQPKRAAVKAGETLGTLKVKYRTVVTVNRNTFKLRVFKALKLSKTYSIAVGAAGHDTPPGLYSISNKAVNPTWNVPNSAWAGSLAGSVVPGGAPNNPLKARWLGIADGVGIHGTSEDWSIGTRASHGCLRMHVKDVVDLYPRVPVGSTVLIK